MFVLGKGCCKREKKSNLRLWRERPCFFASQVTIKKSSLIEKTIWVIGDRGDGFRTGCRIVSRQQQSFSGLQLPRWSFPITVCYSKVQTIFVLNKEMRKHTWFSAVFVSFAGIFLWNSEVKRLKPSKFILSWNFWCLLLRKRNHFFWLFSHPDIFVLYFISEPMSPSKWPERIWLMKNDPNSKYFCYYPVLSLASTFVT